MMSLLIVTRRRWQYRSPRGLISINTAIVRSRLPGGRDKFLKLIVSALGNASETFRAATSYMFSNLRLSVKSKANDSV